MTKFNLELARREATDLVNVTGGVAVLNRSYPVSRAHNRLLVTTTTAVEVSVADAERVLGGAELSHRRIDWVDGDPPVGADRLTSAGWTLERRVHMRLTRPDERTSVDSNALTVPFERLRDTVLQVWLGELPDLSMLEAAQLADRQLATAAGCESSWHAVSVDGASVSWCNLRTGSRRHPGRPDRGRDHPSRPARPRTRESRRTSRRGHGTRPRVRRGLARGGRRRLAAAPLPETGFRRRRPRLVRDACAAIA